MNIDDEERFLTAWAGAWEIYGKEISATALQIAFRALQRFELQDITQALTRHINDPDSGQYVPKPADIVRIIDGSKTTRSALAWTQVDKSIRQVGPYYDVCFSDPIIHAVINDMGGWVHINLKTDKEFPFTQNEFETRYRAYAQHGVKQYPKVLIGIANAHNEARHHKPPVLIGDKDKAALVFAKGSDTQHEMKRLQDYEPLKALEGKAGALE